MLVAGRLGDWIHCAFFPPKEDFSTTRFYFSPACWVVWFLVTPVTLKTQTPMSSPGLERDAGFRKLLLG